MISVICGRFSTILTTHGWPPAYKERRGERIDMFRSVTQIISPYVDFSMVPQDRLLMASERGVRVHDECLNKYARGLWSISLPFDIAGYVESFKRWFDAVVHEVIFVEERLTDTDLGFHGQPDLLVKDKNGLYLMPDLKTPFAKSKSWRLQIAAYTHLALKNYPEIKELKGGSLRLHPEGGTPIMDFYEGSYLSDFAVFTNLLNIDRFFNG